MDCPSCATPNLPDSLYCAHCSEPLTATALARLRSKELREQQTREIELTEAVATRLKSWATTYLWAVGGLVVLFGLVVGKGAWDTRSTVQSGKAQIDAAVASGTTQIATAVTQAQTSVAQAQRDLPGVTHDVQQLKADVAKYTKVNQNIEKIQSDMLRLQNDVVDLGHKTLKAESFEGNGPGPGSMSFRSIGCSRPNLAGVSVTYCAQGSPLVLTSLTPDGRTRPVASYSSIGFQDLSTAPKPSCNESLRGTIYVQKGSFHQGDKPFLCVKSDADTYSWLQISTAN
jgi:hypothetical protein